MPDYLVGPGTGRGGLDGDAGFGPGLTGWTRRVREGLGERRVVGAQALLLKGGEPLVHQGGFAVLLLDTVKHRKVGEAVRGRLLANRESPPVQRLSLRVLL